ncbi:sugar ABC transporter substrate-binding protein [Ideonella azotifigens]|uniref:Ribose ABC transporter substrate-binding protein RbsB n=1 Tax=Ideonella azotifigens TaxID=513160 RepID=A0ABP3UP65_9BURK|nr:MULTISPECIES: sugar ABC transporter substrate-binding protein [Ideonella]MCD2344677.1 sugar ABC transporter substrate-binding protein [Ideonella azotifigens]HSI51908.1 sugar ABC transporter substrate-binding protein [Ideonella sp.]
MIKYRQILPSVLVAFSAAIATHSATAKDITLVYVANNTQYPYDAAVASGFKKACVELGCKAIILNPHSNVERQAHAIEDMVGYKVDGIAAIVADAGQAVQWVDDAAGHNIPFVAAASQVGDPKKGPKYVYEKLTAFVATDDVVAGERAGELAVKLLPHDHAGTIGVVEGAAGFSAVTQRNEGFRKALDKSGIPYKIVASRATDWSPAKGEAVCSEMLKANPKLDLLFSHADDMALGCARAIQAAGAKTRLIATGGGSALGNEAVRSGVFDGSVCTRPGTIGRLAAKALYEAATGKNTAKAQFLTYETPLITRDTLASCPPEW